jgi:hypothetical protein
MRVTCTTLSLPKHGNAPDEYEDAAFPLSFDADEDLQEFRCAVADGATETSFSKLWANLLVSGFVDKEPLPDSRKKWQEQIPSTDQPWYVEEKAQSGAYAALACLTLLADSTWSGEAVGDSCLLQIRDDHIIFSFPLKAAEDFNNRPALVCSKEDSSTEIEPKREVSQWQSGDKFLLLTDAIAHWLLGATEAEAATESEAETEAKAEAEAEAAESVKAQAAVVRLLTLENEEQLLAFATEQRALIGDDGRPKLHNDDITIMKVEIN